MTTATSDRDDILAGALGISSPEERRAYIARACDGDTALRRQVEDLVAAHLQANGSAARPAAAPTTAPSAKEPEHNAVTETAAAGPKALRFQGAAAILLLTSVLSTGLAIWALRKEGASQRAAQDAVQERDRALKAKSEAEHLSEQAAEARQEVARQVDLALAANAKTQRSLEDSRAVLAFLQNRVLTAGRPEGWAGGLGKNVTLRKAVDSAEPEIARTCAGRPLVEAAIRQTIGSTYFDLEEPALAIKQFQRALSLWEKALGASHPNTVTCRNKLAQAYRMADRIDEASRLYDQKSDSAKPQPNSRPIGG